MSATATEKATAATSATIDELFHKALRSYVKALRSGIQLQEEAVNLWKDLLTMLGSTEEFQAKLASITADAFQQARKRMEESVKTFNRTSIQTINGFVGTRHPSNKQLDTLPAADAEKIRRPPVAEEDYAQLFQAWLSR